MCVCVGGGGWAVLIMCPYPLKVQACPLGDQRLATQARVSGWEGKRKHHHYFMGVLSNEQQQVFYTHHPDTIVHATAFVNQLWSVEYWLEQEKAQ